ncbi:hypothetical protein TcasGA2_TC004036 [Tribolium castaneum]|uniref:Uncharacterized protein n=1 Tax=Tribolium castaneum TaxID=7070 RepID=D7EKS0_TRICA|nr:hypothetical protein TcasGA2_TC004036 [Tribolium castaneum]
MAPQAPYLPKEQQLTIGKVFHSVAKQRNDTNKLGVMRMLNLVPQCFNCGCESASIGSPRQIYKIGAFLLSDGTKMAPQTPHLAQHLTTREMFQSVAKQRNDTNEVSAMGI